jgi:hypothetical protein
MKREFRRTTLQKPDVTSADFDGMKVYYDFSTRPILENPVLNNVVSHGNETRMSTYKPEYL